MLALLVALAAQPGSERVLTLDDAIQLAIESHPFVEEEYAKWRVSQNQAKRVWAGLLPNVSGTVGLELTPGDVTAGDALIQRRIQQRAIGNLRWVLADGAHFLAIETAEQRADVSNLCLEEAKMSLVAATKLAYFEALYTERLVAVRRRALQLARVHLERVEVRRELGEATEVESLKAEVEIAEAEQRLIDAENRVELAQIGLANLVGLLDPRGSVPKLRLVRPRGPAPAVADGSLLRTAFELRLDLARRRAELEIAERSVEEAWRGLLLPRLVGTGQITWSDVPGFLGTNLVWQLGLGLEFNVFDSGLSILAIDERAQQVEIAAAELERDRRRVAEQALQARANLRAKTAELKTARRRADLARRTVEMVAANYEGGFASQLELIDAQTRLFDAETMEAAVELQADVARIEVEALVERSPREGPCSIR